VRALFPTRQIPEPTFLEKHEWPQGCSYWLPGDYEVAAASRAAHNPVKGVYVCGESVSQTQTWMEGALESAEILLEMI
jgi:monoamine oxidase